VNDQHVFPLTELPEELFAAAGGKGGVLARLIQAGHPVPAGLVILPGAFEKGELSPDAWRQVQAWLATASANGRAPAFAVRSSALSEDLAAASFAGEFESVLDVRGANNMAQAIRTVVRSQASERVAAYSGAMGLTPAPATETMAVVVQRMVPADFAGVLFTADPVSGDRARMVGNFVRGLGDKLVSGEADAEHFSLAQPYGRYTGPAVLRRFGRQLFRLGQRLEEELGAPQDVEWAIAGGRLALLQARPITTLRAHNPVTGEWNDSLGGDYLWTNTNYGEAIPDVMTPATWSAVQLFMATLLPPSPTASPHPYIGNVGGRFYFNPSLMASVFKSLGFSRARLQLEMEELYGRLPSTLEIPLVPFAPLRLLARLLPFGLRAKRRVAANRQRLPAYVARAPERAAAISAQIEAADTPAALAGLWTAKVLPAFMESAEMLQAGTSQYENSYRPLHHALRRQVGLEEANTLLSDVSKGDQPLASLGPVVGLWQVAQGQLSREAFAAAHGHRGPHELELAWPRPYEEPTWIERQLAEQRRHPVDVAGLLAQRQAQQAAAWQRYAARFPRQAPATRRQLAAAAAGARAREGARSALTRMFGVLRAFALRAGALTGLADDIFFLSLDEMKTLLDGDQTVAASVPARRATHARYSALPPYPALIRGRFDPFAWAAGPNRRSDVFDAHAAPADAVPGDNTLTGYPGAAGVVEGTVRVLRSVEEGPALQAGEVLVAATTNIGWTPLFPRAAAVVTDVGAPLSHAAIVARELGIPAVVGTGQATTRLCTGDRVRVNGGQGTVIILER
jgi:phosphohistidine swiveling domain-containing protein